ncbi:MAG: hypothetical protein ACKVJN_11990, partial [Woeseiales bacterium]
LHQRSIGSVAAIHFPVSGDQISAHYLLIRLREKARKDTEPSRPAQRQTGIMEPNTLYWD